MSRWLLDFSVQAPGGSSVHAEGFLRVLADSGPPVGVDLTVLVPKDSLAAEVEKMLCSRGIRVMNLPLGGAGTWRARLDRHLAVPAVSWLLASDVVFVPREAAPILCRGRLVVLCRNMKVWRRDPTLRSVHEVRWRLLNLAGRLAVHRAARVLATSATFAQSIPVSGSRVSVVYHGCDLAYADHARPLLDGREFRVVCIGTLSRHKRFDVAIEAVSELRRAGQPASLNIWGAEGEANERTRLRRLGVELLGADPTRGVLPHADRLAVLSSADALFVGSSFESFGMPLVEAMRTGALAWAPASPLVDELSAGTAVTYREGDPVDAANELLAALLDAAERRLRGIEESRRFTWRKCAATTFTEMEKAGRRAMS